MYMNIGNKKYSVTLMNSFFERLKGLMFKEDAIEQIYMFPRCSSIHTYFMKQNIDVCILDKNFCVIYVQENVKPRSIIIKKGYYTLEMPLGTGKSINVGQKLNIKNM